MIKDNVLPSIFQPPIQPVVGFIIQKDVYNKKLKVSKNKYNIANSNSFLKEDSHNKILNKSKSPNNRNSINIIKIKNVNFGIINNKNKRSKQKNKNANKNVNRIKKHLTFNKNKLGSIFGDKNIIRKEKHLKTSKSYLNKKKKQKLIFKSNKNDIINNNLNDQELNNLSYEKALLIDKRTFFQYYFSLLRTKHIILFTFCQFNDYNLFSIKLCLFLLSFSLYLSIHSLSKTLNLHFLVSYYFYLVIFHKKTTKSCLIEIF